MHVVQTCAQKAYNTSEGLQDLRRPTGPEKARATAVQEVCVCEVRCSAKGVCVMRGALEKVSGAVKVSKYIVGSL